MAIATVVRRFRYLPLPVQMWLVFRNGSRNQPKRLLKSKTSQSAITPSVPWYFRPFWLNVYGSFMHRRSKFLCYGNSAMHGLQLNYLSQFLLKYKGWLASLESFGHNTISPFSTPLSKSKSHAKSGFVLCTRIRSSVGTSYTWEFYGMNT